MSEPLSAKGYVEIGGIICPSCRSAHLSCRSCHATWTAIYELAGYTGLSREDDA